MVEDHHLPVPSNLNPNPNHWSMVVIRHHHDDANECSVFPPVNHENLQIFPHSQHHIENPTIPQSPPPFSSSSSSCSSSFSPSDSDTCGLSFPSPFDSQVGKRCGGGNFVRWMSIGLEIMRSKLSAVASSFRSGASRRGAFWSIWVPTAVVVMSSWIMMRKRRRRRRTLTQNETRLLDIIKEKDEKIGQLLHQIAQMNEVLIARHKALAATVAK